MSTLWNELRYAVRMLRKSPVFTAIAVLSLAVGMGANTAIFSLVDQILLRLLPVKEPEQLVLLSMKGAHYGSNWGGNALSYPMYSDFRDNNQVFSGMFCRFPTAASLTFGGQTERVAAELVSGTYFQVLGVGASLGRTFTPAEDKVPVGHPLAVLSYSYWKTRFAGDPAIVGKTVVINGNNMTVIGVAQEGFDGVELGYTTKIFVPVMMKKQITPLWDGMENRRWRWVNAFARLKPGVTMTQAQASLQPFFHGMLEMEVKEAAFRNASPEARQRFLQNVIEVLPGSQGRSYQRRTLKTPLWVLMAVTGGVLLIACANVAGLLIARAASRQREVAIRLALGAGRFRIIRQLLFESLLLAGMGGVLGLALATWTNRLLLAMMPPETSSLNLSTTPDWRVLLFTGAVCCATGILFGLVPALQGTRPNLAPTLKDQAGAVVGGNAPVRMRKALVTAQVTLSLLLLIGAGLFIRSLQNLRELGPGFRPDHLLAFNIDPSLNGYDNERSKAFYLRLTDTVAAIPGIQATGLASMRILEDNEWDSGVTVEGYAAKPNEGPQPYMNSIGPGYFATLGVPILSGRDFTLRDTEQIKHGPDKDDFTPRVVIINEKFAKRFFAGVDPIGRHVGFGSDPGTKTDMEVVGVIKDIKYTNVRDDVPVQMFIPYMANRFVGGMTVYLRTSLDPTQAFSAVRSQVRQLDPNLPIYAMRTMDEQISNSLLIERLIAGLSTIFGCLATVLATIGLYGVMAYTVERRTREIGIRMALGAVHGDVIWLVMREVLALVAIGVVAGLAATFALTKYVQSQLFGITRTDPITMVLATLGLAAVACLAGYIPALRASRSDPMQALRYE
ncbi:MAG: ABC transporter permease [Candidatus Solibacter usitatus]|nr:ABC transporter permease [Candidatus Solibacter usitatus]